MARMTFKQARDARDAQRKPPFVLDEGWYEAVVVGAERRMSERVGSSAAALAVKYQVETGNSEMPRHTFEDTIWDTKADGTDNEWGIVDKFTLAQAAGITVGDDDTDFDPIALLKERVRIRVVVEEGTPYVNRKGQPDKYRDKNRVKDWEPAGSPGLPPTGVAPVHAPPPGHVPPEEPDIPF